MRQIRHGMRSVRGGAAIGLLALVLVAGLVTACARDVGPSASPVNVYEQWPLTQASGSLWGYIREIDAEERVITFGIYGKWANCEMEHRIRVDVPPSAELHLEDGLTSEFWGEASKDPERLISKGDVTELVELSYTSNSGKVTATAVAERAEWPMTPEESESQDPLPWMRQVVGGERTYEVTGSIQQAQPVNPRALQVSVFCEDDGIAVTHVFWINLSDTSILSSVDGTPMSESEFLRALKAGPVDSSWVAVFSAEVAGLFARSIAPATGADADGAAD